MRSSSVRAATSVAVRAPNRRRSSVRLVLAFSIVSCRTPAAITSSAAPTSYRSDPTSIGWAMNGAPSPLRRWPACCSAANANAARVLGRGATRSGNPRPPLTTDASLRDPAFSEENIYFNCISPSHRLRRPRVNLCLGLLLDRGGRHRDSRGGVGGGGIERLGQEQCVGEAVELAAMGPEQIRDGRVG